MCEYYGYTRVSTETQSEKGYGLDAQKAAIDEYASEMAIKIKSVYTDAGVSGNLKDDAEDDAINKRHGLIEMLSVINPNDTVIVMNTSRLWRSDLTKAIIRREFIKRKINLISIEQPRYDLYSKNPSDYLINSIMEALDVYERMSISLKLARGRTIKAKTGAKPAGICPYGYKYSDDKKSVVVDDNEANIVRYMYTEGQKGKSFGKIANSLNAKGVKTRRGGIWQRGSIQAILRNDFYIGVLHHSGQAIKGTHEPIISKIQYGKVQAQLIKRQRKKGDEKGDKKRND